MLSFLKLWPCDNVQTREQNSIEEEGVRSAVRLRRVKAGRRLIHRMVLWSVPDTLTVVKGRIRGLPA
ncbi:hypothetical protein Baya_1724 [Bagarius yarrelli]|uniref:Uncharacterized protein n=1 Tax=Bagarius yarrelli TaxID=175774 RepID=A0A556TLZ8_BAGYA|nr:hypothetical protein Baya_1724 [Bagarius yarrelli]